MPSVADVLRLLEQADPATPVVPGHRPEPADGSLELVAQGLAFDVTGLSEGAPLAAPVARHHFGLTAPLPGGLAAVIVRPGLHLQAAANLLPVVRVLAGIGAQLAALPGVAAVCWLPAASAIAPQPFASAVSNWLAGGPFPALGLTALVPAPDGTIRSEGLSFFTGQELRIEPSACRDARHGARIAVRLIDELVAAEPLRSPTRFTGPEGEALIAEPDGEYVVIRIYSEA